MPKAAQFISIEGGEGTGKSLFTEGLCRALRGESITVQLTREPGGTPLADRIRGLFLDPPAEDKPTALTELFLVSAARAQHIERKIRPALAEGQWVICDRFYDSTRIYQGELGGLPDEVLEPVIELSVKDCHPHISFLLDCPADLARKRVSERTQRNGGGDTNRYDAGTLAMYERLRAGYLRLAKAHGERIVVLDATKEPAEVLAQALDCLRSRGYL